MFNLEQKTAVITGGGSGIGKAIAELFAMQGAIVYILELNSESAQQTLTAIQSKGKKASVLSCNVSDQKQVMELMGQIVQRTGRIDILVNSAGIAHIGKLESASEADMDRVFQVNVKGAYNTMYAVVDQMKKQGGGVILNLCSVAASVGVAERFAYSMSKGAVEAMTYSVAKDYIQNNIRCNCISPARIHTSFVDGFLKANYPGREQEMFEKLSKTQPIGRMGKPEEVAALALYLCADESAFVTGTNYPIDGGFLTLNT
jgi:2-keto-3-deoxy-L-fuconate dehydrogenase